MPPLAVDLCRGLRGFKCQGWASRELRGLGRHLRPVLAEFFSGPPSPNLHDREFFETA
jgi:hypothetical protein